MFSDLQTTRLTLRRFRLKDAPAFLAYRSLPEVSRYQVWEQRSLGEIRAFITAQQRLKPNIPGAWLQLAIFLRGNNLLIGDCGLHFVKGDDKQTEIGISLSPVYQGQGYAAEALHAVFEYLFGSLGKHRVYASVDPRNLPSAALMERVGMRKEAHFSKSLWFKGEWVDDVIFALLEDEWRSGQSNHD